MARPKATPLAPDPTPDDAGDGVAVLDPPEAPIADTAAAEAVDAPADAPAAEDTGEPLDAPAENSEYCAQSDAAPLIEADPLPIAGTYIQLSPTQQDFLRKQPACQIALHHVLTAESELADAMLRAEEAKTAEKGKKTALEAAYKALKLAVMGEEEFSATPLFDGATTNNGTHAPSPAPESAPSADAADWQRRWEKFLDRSINVLDVSETIREKLRDHSPDPITTLRSLTKLKEINPVKGYCSVKGIGEEKANKLDNAWDALLAAFLKDNPNPASARPADATPDAAEAPPADAYDFISTFPVAVDPTPNESYTADYHKNGINEAVGELTEIAVIKESLKSGMSKGKKITDKTRQRLNDALAETQLQYDESLAGYAKTFGDKASEKLRKFVEAQAQKKASLKGGLD